VSISALCVPDTVYLGWVGDCVGCVFDSATHTIYSHGTMTDFAEAETTQCDSAQSVPHCFSSEPILLINHRSRRHRHAAAAVEHYETYSDQVIYHFPDDASQREYEKLQRAHATTVLKIDNTMLMVGDSPRMLVDARIARSVQPTRVLGDVAQDMPLRHPTVMRVDTATTSRRVLLCSDGVMSRGAFADMQAVVACVKNPLEFIQASFFRRGQEVTERLIACGHLAASELGLYGMQTWSELAVFLRTKHLPTLRSRKFCTTFVEYHQSNWLRLCPDHHLHWLCACEASIEWFERLPLIHDAHVRAHVVAHLAIVMGSVDNVTVLLTS
jgi:hypothetical protein